ncbi:MAG: hypothetical protein LUF30_01325 [Lachnospiraceae bacterium]|nr:hypothetical protein [Lachnospiraceae bacterium]
MAYQGNDPVLVIGLGGSGIDAMLAAKNLICEKRLGGGNRDSSGDETEKNGFADDPANIAYLGIDTDETSLHKSCQGTGLNREEDEIFICPHLDLRWMAAHPETLPERVTEWLDSAPFDPYKETPDAAPTRPMARLMMLMHMEEILSVLEKKIRRITEASKPDATLWVFIMNSLAGCTGSGMFLDLPYLVRAVSSSLSPRPVRTLGMFFLSEVHTGISDATDEILEDLHANEYVALGELDYFMCMETSKAAFEGSYHPLKAGMKADTSVKPYDICLLYSGRVSMGRQKEREPDFDFFAYGSGDGDADFEFYAYDTECGDTDYDLAISAAAGTIWMLTAENEDKDDTGNGSTGKGSTGGNHDTGADGCAAFQLHRWVSDAGKKRPEIRRKQGKTGYPQSYGYTLVNLAYLGYDHLIEHRLKAELEAEIPKVEPYGLDRCNHFFRGNFSVVPDRLDPSFHVYQKQINAVRDNLQKAEDALADYLETACQEIPENQEQEQQCIRFEQALLDELEKYRTYFCEKLKTQSKQVEELEARRDQMWECTKWGRYDIKRSKLLAYRELLVRLYKAELDELVSKELLDFCETAKTLIDRNYLAMKELPDTPADFFLKALSHLRGMTSEEYASVIVKELCENVRDHDSLELAGLPDMRELPGAIYLTIPKRPAGWPGKVEKACVSIDRETSIGKDSDGIRIESSERLGGILAIHFQSECPLWALKNGMLFIYGREHTGFRDRSAGRRLFRV